MGMLTLLAGSLCLAVQGERAASCVAYLNANSSATAIAPENINSILTEFDIHPTIPGKDIRIALTGWGQGTEDDNPYPPTDRFGDTEKYPGYQEIRVTEDNVKVEFAIQQNGVWQRVTFGGNGVGTIAPGTHVWSDWAPIIVRRGDSIRARIRIEAANPNFGRLLYTSSWAYDYRMYRSWAGNVAPAIDASDFKGNTFRYYNGGIAGAAISVLPAVIQTKSSDPNLRVVAAFGDSVLRAGNDGGSFANPAGFHYPGWVGRGFQKLNIPVVAFGVSGDRSEINTPETMTRRLALLADCGVDYAVIQHGLNDSASPSAYNGGRTSAAEMLDRNLAFARTLKEVGVPKVYLATILPNTVSTDLWITNANQTPKTNGFEVANWLEYNRNLRLSKPADIYGIIDPQQLISDANGMWFDGTWQGSRTATKASAGTTVTLNCYFVYDQKQGYYANYVLKATSGPNSGRLVRIDRSFATAMNVDLLCNAAFPNPVNVGDTFSICRPLTRDGNHPSTEGFKQASGAIANFPNLFP